MLPCADCSESLVKERLATYQLNCASVARIAHGDLRDARNDSSRIGHWTVRGGLVSQ